MKVLSICYDDYANLMYNNTQAMKAAGIDADCCKRRNHAFGYSNQAPIASTSQMMEMARSFDIVQVFHTWEFIGNKAFENNKKVIWHTGTSYRLNPNPYNDFFNPVVDMTITDQPEFMCLGAKNIHYMATAIDTDKIKPIDREITSPYRIGHFPSNPGFKGSDKVCEMVREVQKKYPGKFIFDYSEKRIPHQANLERIARCDIYIEMFKPMMWSKEYGCFGVTAFEAAALGCRVITQNCYPAVYENAYGGDPPFAYARYEGTFQAALALIGSHYSLKELKTLTREKLVEKHSMKATGERMKKLLSSL
jgi:hypothetical protein